MARAAVETEDSMAQRRFQMRRVAGKIVVACSQELAAFAEKLGQVADDLAGDRSAAAAAAGLPGALRGAASRSSRTAASPSATNGC